LRCDVSSFKDEANAVTFKARIIWVFGGEAITPRRQRKKTFPSHVSEHSLFAYGY
jgi:hypothetical protein